MGQARKHKRRNKPTHTDKLERLRVAEERYRSSCGPMTAPLTKEQAKAREEVLEYARDNWTSLRSVLDGDEVVFIQVLDDVDRELYSARAALELDPEIKAHLEKSALPATKFIAAGMSRTQALANARAEGWHSDSLNMLSHPPPPLGVMVVFSGSSCGSHVVTLFASASMERPAGQA